MHIYIHNILNDDLIDTQSESNTTKMIKNMITKLICVIGPWALR